MAVAVLHGCSKWLVRAVFVVPTRLALLIAIFLKLWEGRMRMRRACVFVILSIKGVIFQSSDVRDGAALDNTHHVCEECQKQTSQNWSFPK